MKTRSGKVVKKKFGAGSKSDHMAYFLIADNGDEFVLRRRDANPFMDDFFEAFVGKQVQCKGEVEDYILFAGENGIKEI
jgi:hypothetical protein